MNWTELCQDKSPESSILHTLPLTLTLIKVLQRRACRGFGERRCFSKCVSYFQAWRMDVQNDLLYSCHTLRLMQCNIIRLCQCSNAIALRSANVFFFYVHFIVYNLSSRTVFVVIKITRQQCIGGIILVTSS